MIKHTKALLMLACAGMMLVPALRASAATRTNGHTQKSPQVIAQEVRQRLVLLPYYDLFDWLEGDVSAEGVVTLRGQVVKPVTKTDAESAIRGIEGVEKVVNEIEVLPVSEDDARLRVVMYRALFGWTSPLFHYATQAVPPIHIIIKNGYVTLKGVVATPQESEIAFMKANGVSGLVEVKNELKVENASPK